MNGDPKQNTLVEVRDLKTYFHSEEGVVRAVDGVSFSVREGETVALVGESGCGKSVTALSLARLVPEPPGWYAGGTVHFEERNVMQMNLDELRRLRGNEISYVFQEPGTSLNPVFRVGYQIGEAVRLHRPDEDAKAEVRRMMQMVGLPDPERRAKAYPHELSGGMQQRVMMAMALACDPKLLVADEPTTALDVTIQAQILELLAELQQNLDMAVLLITHNLGLVADVAHFVNIMYAGRIVESGPTKEVLRNPAHPYTLGLLHAVPRLEGVGGKLTGIEGSVPNPVNPPPGCKFHPRCPYRQDRCGESEPEIEDVGGGRKARCWLWEKVISETRTLNTQT